MTTETKNVSRRGVLKRKSMTSPNGQTRLFAPEAQL